MFSVRRFQLWVWYALLVPCPSPSLQESGTVILPWWDCLLKSFQKYSM
jgi:hypothetical protein